MASVSMSLCKTEKTQRAGHEPLCSLSFLIVSLRQLLPHFVREDKETKKTLCYNDAIKIRRISVYDFITEELL